MAQIALHDEEGTGVTLTDVMGEVKVELAVYPEGHAAIKVNETVID